VLDRGQIVEQGQHEQLLANKGAYYRLDRAQTKFFTGTEPAADAAAADAEDAENDENDDDDAADTMASRKEI
jgi:ABC-type glutathione transport system ATPase component